MNKIIKLLVVTFVLTSTLTNSTQAAFFSWTDLKNFISPNAISVAAVEEASIPEIEIKELKVIKKYKVSLSAYSSTPDQTDDSPFITASGTHVRDGIVAANFLPIGTAVKIPGLFGDKIFIVEDRMNARYKSGYMDIWFPDRESALQFGRKVAEIEVVS